MPALIASQDGGFFPPRAKSNQETERRLGDEAKGYGACSRASRGPSLPLPSSPPPVHAAAWLARPRGLSVAGPSTPKTSRARIGIRVVLWSRGVGESEARRLFFPLPLSLFVLCCGRAVKTRGVERRGWVGSGVLVVSLGPSPPSYASPRFCHSFLFFCTKAGLKQRFPVPRSGVP
jgi:hypothetical protein